MPKNDETSRRQVIAGIAGAAVAAAFRPIAAAEKPTVGGLMIPKATFEDRSLNPLDLMKSLSNWGRWGKDDVLGTLNLITPKTRAAAFATLREGITVGCGFKYKVQVGRGTPQRFMMMMPRDMQPIAGPHAGEAAEQVLIGTHEGWGTHLDGLNHTYMDGKMYNGFSVDNLKTMEGAGAADLTHLGAGIVGRGVLLDATKLLGVKTLEPGYAVKPEHLEEMERRQGVKVREGDILFLRVGLDTRYLEGADMARSGCWHASCLPWFHKRGVAAIGGDHGDELFPSGFEWSEIPYPIHWVGIPAMGLWLIDWCDLEALAAKCAELKRYAFLMSIGTLRIPGTSASPVQPIAMF